MQPDDDKTGTYVPLTSGTMFSHYRIIEKIGASGNGGSVVFNILAD